MSKNVQKILAVCAIPITSAAAMPSSPSGPELLQAIVSVVDTGDQAAFERFAHKDYAPSVLTETSAQLQGAALARLYTDTAGIRIERIVGEAPGWVQAEGRDKMSGTRQCLTLRLKNEAGRIYIGSLATQGLYDSGPQLAQAGSSEIVNTLGGLAARYAARGLLSGVVLIGKDDKVIFQKAYGYASLAHNDSMTVSTRLNVASIAKSITGAAIAHLVDEGRLSYDDKVGRILTDYPDKAVRDRVTVRHLLSHTSGLGPLDYYEKPEWDSAKPLLRSVRDYLELIQKEGISTGAPSGQYLYSNAGYVILGAIIEKVTGESFYHYVAREIFRRSGMSSSFYHETDAEDRNVAEPLTNLFALGPNSYFYRLGRPRSAIYELAARGGPQGGATLTARDLFRFVVALRSGKLTSKDRLKEMLTPASPSGAGAGGLAGDVREGLGIEVVRQNGHTFYGHTGGDLGIAASAYWYPDSGYSVIILTNRDPRAARVLTNVSRGLLTRQTLNAATVPQQHCIRPSQ